MAKITSLKDFIVLLLYAKGHQNKQCEPIKGRTRLMKMVFLFNEEVKKSFNAGHTISDGVLPDFKAYDYGPFSEKVYADLEFLVDSGFVKIKHERENLAAEELEEYQYWQTTSGVRDQLDASDGIDEFSLSEIGRGFVKDEELGELSTEQWDLLNKFKARCTGIPLRNLLRYVYVKYPKMITNSKIADEILKK